MAIDYVTVANLATGFFGEDDQISDPDEDSKPARTVKAAWEPLRLFVLGKADWSFASRRVNLAARPATDEWPIIGYASAYPLPTDFVRLIQLGGEYLDEDCYAIEAGEARRELLVDRTGPLVLRYVFDQDDVTRWSPEFVEAFSMRLAWQIADRLSGDKQRKQQALDAYTRTIAEARGSDARQKAPRDQHETDWSRARRGYGTFNRAPGTY